MTRFLVHIGLIVVCAALGIQVSPTQAQLYEGEIRYLGYAEQGFYAVRSIDLARRLSTEVVLPERVVHFPALSSDGNYLWFNNENGTFVFNVATQELRQVYDQRLRVYWFHTSPEVLLTLWIDLDHPLRIFRADMDGGNFRELTPDDSIASCGGLDISPDDSQIVIDGCSVLESTLSFINTDGTNFYHLPDTFSDTFFPSWSPDGSYVAFMQYQGVLNTINIIHPDGSEVHNLVSSEGIINDFYWSPDSNAIATLANFEGNNNQAIVAGLDGQVNTFDFISMSSMMEWSPDGQVLMIVTNTQGNPNYTFTFYNPSNWQVLSWVESHYQHLWSVDGNLFAYVTSTYDELCVLNVTDWSTRYCVAVDRPSSSPSVMRWLP